MCETHVKKKRKLEFLSPDPVKIGTLSDVDFSFLPTESNDADPPPANKDQSTQTQYDKYFLGAKIETMILRNQIKSNDNNVKSSCNHDCTNSMSSAHILTDQKKCKYFIGLYPDQFEALFNFLGPAKYVLSYWHSEIKHKSKNNIVMSSSKLDVKEQLFVTLVRLRRGFNLLTLAYMYGVSESYIRNIFTTWIMFLFCHFKDHKNLMFPARQDFRKFVPKIFKRFRNIRCSVDCTEFFCEMSRDYGKQGNTYSSYKHHCTMKRLIAVNPNGAACFVSDLYEGSIDDVSIFEQCGILSHINPGDSLLADKGFTVQDLLLPKQATIYIPPFLGKRDSFTKEEIIQTKRIAKARIHVERFNERLKTFRLIDRTIPQTLGPIASQLVYAACCLVNFQDCLCKQFFTFNYTIYTRCFYKKHTFLASGWCFLSFCQIQPQIFLKCFL